MPETIEQKLRRWCAEMRANGYLEEDIFFALAGEMNRIDGLAELSEPAPPRVCPKCGSGIGPASVT